MSGLSVKRLKNVYALILARPVLHTLISWRFLLPNQPWTVQLHRQVLLCAWPSFPRWIWGLIAIYSSATWLLWHSWRQIYQSYHKNSKTVLTRDRISATQQLTGLVKAAYLHGIPAHAYYQFKLYRYPEKHWLNFIYTHELPHWHQCFSSKTSTTSQQLLSDKHLFSSRLSQHGIQTVTSLKTLKRGQRISQNDLLTKQSCFLKPNVGSRAEGCLTLNYDSNADSYSLTIEKTGEVIDQSYIPDYINQQVLQRDYLIQPLLTNHPLIQQYSPIEKLVTLRLISACEHNQQPVVVSALLEITSPEHNNSWWLIAVDCETGCFIDSTDDWLNPSPSFVKAIKSMATKAMPLWTDCVATCLQAHRMCPDIASIGWDVVITPNGVQLLEGNFNWGIAQHQIAYNKPALDSALGDVYRTQSY